MEMIEKRVRDGSVLQLIWKWIQVGVIDEGRLLVSETGTGQGQTISPLLANIYLHRDRLRMHAAWTRRPGWAKKTDHFSSTIWRNILNSSVKK
jgi:RNA-directed DNA polymerase